ncbi:septation protein SepH [Rothia sp. AR01]|uniref:Septation protein SepH n=1 Tax=Rothia santali TaxID=2949643 RepID=A0A9X2KIQ6_9MICC|nr:septation protein SepH [Rothia santali]MCP3427147.1 septation protein SepH [Rothia santali]
MQQLRFVGVHDDGEHLVLEAPESGERFRVVIDSSLRNAVLKARRAHPARGLSGNGVFGPRDIQTRFRQGATIDEIVAESGWKPERVKRYEWPILAERAHIVKAARAVLVDPLGSAADDAARLSLNDQVVAVRERLNFAEGDAHWNSWQREDGQWNVSASVDYSRAALDQIPEGADFPARFVYNPANQTVVAGNAVAEFLLGRTLDRPAPAPESQATSPDEPADHEEHPEPSGGQQEPGREPDAAPRPATLQAVPADDDDAAARLLDELEERRGTARARTRAATTGSATSPTGSAGRPASPPATTSRAAGSPPRTARAPSPPRATSPPGGARPASARTTTPDGRVPTPARRPPRPADAASAPPSRAGTTSSSATATRRHMHDRPPHAR